MPAQVFLGGSCGATQWRTEVAIPMLREAGVTYFNPQMPDGDWTPAHQDIDMEAKARADVWLFVINEHTRGVAAVAECAYRIGQNGRLALALTELPVGATIGGVPLGARERDDLNRGRVFLRAMAREHSVPVMDSVTEATAHAIVLARQARNEFTRERLDAVLRRVSVPGFDFVPETVSGSLCVRIRKKEFNRDTGGVEPMWGRRWLIDREAGEDEVVRTLLKAALTWEEHELRERFLLDDRLVFDPHIPLRSHGISGPP